MMLDGNFLHRADAALSLSSGPDRDHGSGTLGAVGWRTRRDRFARALVLASSIGAFATGTAYAQETAKSAVEEASSETHAESSGEILVTARRREENLQDVPVAVTVLSSTELQQLRVLKSTDLGQVAPGLSASPSNRGSSSPTFAIRGVRGPNTQTLLIDPAVSIYFAQFNLSRAIGTNSSLFDIDSVQVLKGPQGTLFGRNSTGGAVLIEPKKPVFELDGYGQVSLGDYSYRDVEAVLNIPFSEKVALRVGGKISKRDGYLHYVGTGQDVDDLDAKSARVSLRIQPTDTIDSTFIGTYYHGGGAGEGTKLIQAEPRNASAGFRGARSLFNQTIQDLLTATQALPKYQAFETTRQSLSETTYSIQNNTTIELGETGFLGDVSLVNIMGYKKVKVRQDGAGLSGVGFSLYAFDNTNIRSHQFSEEFQIQGKLPNFSYVLGGFYFREAGTDEFTVNQFFGIKDPTFQARMLAAIGPAEAAIVNATFPVRGINNIEVVNKSYAAFAHGELDLPSVLPGLSLAGGARITHDNRAVVFHNQVASGLVPTVYRCAALGTTLPGIDPVACSLGGSRGFTALTYDGSISYKVSPSFMVYATSRYGYRSGGFTTTPPLAGTLSSASFGPEYNRDVEIGFKSTIRADGVKARFNVAAFHSWYTDIQQTVTRVINNVQSSITDNAAKAHIDGVEAELIIDLGDSLQLSASGSVIKPKFDEWTDLVRSNGVLVPIDLSDSKFAWLPYKQFVLSAQYTLPVPDSWGTVSIRGTVQGQSKTYPVNPATQNCGPAVPAGSPPAYPACLAIAGKLDGFSIVKLRADWRNVAGKGFDLSFFVDNLTNKYYFPAAFTALGSALTVNAVNVGAPRMFGFELRVPFGASGY